MNTKFFVGHKYDYERQCDTNDKIPKDVGIDFCINHCPHPKKACNGSCIEYREFVKEARNK